MFIVCLRAPFIYGGSRKRPNYSEKGGECDGDLRRGRDVGGLEKNMEK